ncbi:MAG: hypothetical protein HGB19_09480 [Chlorobiales bacterium]|jgi:hypothetical protein|nr:hypothetical protein [Chlorobiales bacterium]
MKKQKCPSCGKTKPEPDFVEKLADAKAGKIVHEVCKDCRQRKELARQKQVFSVVLKKAKALGLVSNRHNKPIDLQKSQES